MDPLHKPLNIKDIKQEILSLINMLYDKVDLEVKFGANFSSFSQKEKTHSILTNIITDARENKKVVLSESNILDKKEGPGKSGKIEALKELEELVKKCTSCGLCNSRTNVVFGTGAPNADLMFVGEAPGYYEDAKGEPFVGKAGQLLTKIIEAINLKRGDVYIANILKCRPPENRNPAANEIILCKPNLYKQIEIISPKIICALGTFAAQTLLETNDSIGSLRGRFHDYQSTKLLATYHPAYLLRNPNEKRKTWEDMKKVRDFLKETN